MDAALFARTWALNTRGRERFPHALCISQQTKIPLDQWSLDACPLVQECIRNADTAADAVSALNSLPTYKIALERIDACQLVSHLEATTDGNCYTVLVPSDEMFARDVGTRIGFEDFASITHYVIAHGGDRPLTAQHLRDAAQRANASLVNVHSDKLMVCKDGQLLSKKTNSLANVSMFHDLGAVTGNESKRVHFVALNMPAA